MDPEVQAALAFPRPPGPVDLVDVSDGRGERTALQFVGGPSPVEAAREEVRWRFYRLAHAMYLRAEASGRPLPHTREVVASLEAALRDVATGVAGRRGLRIRAEILDGAAPWAVPGHLAVNVRVSLPREWSPLF